MIEIVFILLFFTGVAGAVAILARRMPQAQRSAVVSVELNAANLTQVAKFWCVSRIKRMPYLRDFDWMDFVQKMLMRGRVMVLKAENKINDYMVKLRQKAEAEQKKDAQTLDNYWHDIKTIVKTKKPDSTHNSDGAGKSDLDAVDLANTKVVYPQELEVPGLGADSEDKLQEPAVSRVVMPQETGLPGRKKKRLAKKKKFKDPFQW